MDKKEKKILLETYKENFLNLKSVLLINYLGISVDKITQLRNQLRTFQSKLQVVKNRVMLKLIEEDKTFSPLQPFFKDSIAVLYISKDIDIVKNIKTIIKFQKEFEALKIVAGVIEGKFVDQAQIKQLSQLPDRQVIFSNILSSLLLPQRHLVVSLSDLHRKILYLINSVNSIKK